MRSLPKIRANSNVIFRKMLEAACRFKRFMSHKPSGSYATFFQEIVMKLERRNQLRNWHVSEGMLMKWILKETTILLLTVSCNLKCRVFLYQLSDSCNIAKSPISGLIEIQGPTNYGTGHLAQLFLFFNLTRRFETMLASI